MTDGADLKAQVQQCLDRNDLTGAIAVATDAVVHAPGEAASYLELGRLLEQAGRHDEASDLYDRARIRFPRNPWLAGRRAVTLARQGQGAEALALYHDVLAPSKLSEAQRTVFARQIAQPLRRDPDAGRLLKQRVAVTPDDAALLREAGSSARATGDLADAIDYLDRSAALKPLPNWAHAIRIDVRHKLALRSKQWPVVDPAFEAALEAAMVQNPLNPAYVRFVNRLPLPRATWQRLFSHIRASAVLSSSDGFLLYETMLAALQADDRDFARSAAAALIPGSDWARRAAPMVDLLEKVPPAIWARSRLVDDKAAEKQVIRVPGAQATLLVFATLTGNFMMLPLAMLDALLADIPVNIIYLRDTTSTAPGLRGYKSLGGTVEDSITHIRAEVEALGAPRLLTLGASASGLSAIRYGARLGTERAVTFGAITSLGADVTRPRPGADKLTAAAIVQARQRFRDIGAELDASNGMKVAFHFGDGYELDVDHARRIEHLPGVTIHPAAGIDHHYVVLSLIAAGTFRDALWAD